MQFPISLVEGPMDISLKGGINPFHPLMSLYMIYSMSNYSLYYHLITDDVEQCQNINPPLLGTYGGVRLRTKRRHYYDEKYL